MQDQRKSAVVTGAGSGIGRAVAIALSRRGYRLALAGRQLSRLEETLGLLAGPDNIAVSADISDEDTVDELFERAISAFGRVDLLFNNAGQGAFSTPIDQIDTADWRRVIEVNLTGSFLCLRAAFRVMKAQTPAGGRIINNGSISAHVPRPHAAAYAASKHGVTGLTKAAALEGRSCGIAVCQIDIGNAASELAAPIATGLLQADGSVRPEPLIDAALVGDAVCHMDSLPLEANIPFLTLMATGMPYFGRG